MMRIFRHKESITGENCHQVARHNLVLAGDVTYGVEIQFENEGRTALRLSHFLCNFFQVSLQVMTKIQNVFQDRKCIETELKANLTN